MDIQAIMDRMVSLEKELLETKRQLRHYKEACDKALEIISKHENAPRSCDVFKCTNIECQATERWINLPLDKSCLKCGSSMYNTEEELSIEEILKKRA